MSLASRVLANLICLGWSFTGGALLVAEEVDADGLALYQSQIAPLLKEHCYKCHGAGQVKGGLRLVSRSGLLSGGDSGPALDLVRPEDSLLLEAVNYKTYEMPPSGKLPAEEIALLTRWVQQGAPMPDVPAGDQSTAPAAHGSPEVNDQTRSHWAFQPVVRPEVPRVSHPDWVSNPIDAFLLARLDSAGLTPAPPADRAVLVRRLYYDLIGLPPTPEQVAAFLADDSPRAYERLVDELLDSPHYGEHWARYWLDLVRYAETNSFERDDPKPFVWRYRDYVIRAFNDDKPFDELVLEQLAGDELDEVTPDGIIATGYYRLGIWDDEPADRELAYYDGLDDVVATTAQVFLGLTMNCARCHEHKLDPIPQRDYYRFLAFFRNVREYGVRSDESVLEASVCDIDLPEERAAREEVRLRNERRLAEVRERMRWIEQEALRKLEGGERDDFQDASARLDILRRGVGRLLTEDQWQEYARSAGELKQLERSPPAGSAQALCVKEHGAEAPPTHVLVRGNPRVPGEEVEPGFPSVLGVPDPAIVRPAHGQSTGRRRALAEWIASGDNPLTARVLANRLWQWHLGRGLVRSSNNFGLQGDAATHPELLDWLAAELVSQRWSLKAMHRLILQSSAYRMSSRGDRQALERDPRNDLFGRFDMRRLRAEEVRDSILAVNGSLNLERMFGASIYPVIPGEVLAGQSRPGEGWGTSTDDDVRRRSIYIHIKRSLAVPLLAAFDVAETDFTCPVRFTTTQPTQALGLLNSTFLNEQSALFASRLIAEAGDNRPVQVRLALERTLQRVPRDEEVSRGMKLLMSLEEEQGLSPDEALRYFCLAALNLNEFVYLD
jgi:mono/diheme cytochrome c family protein